MFIGFSTKSTIQLFLGSHHLCKKSRRLENPWPINHMYYTMVFHSHYCQTCTIIKYGNPHVFPTYSQFFSTTFPLLTIYWVAPYPKKINPHLHQPMLQATGVQPCWQKPIDLYLATDGSRLIGFATDSGWWFLATPLKNMSSSIGMMKFPILMGK